MRRGVFEVLRRGLDNTLANWPLILIRFAEAVTFAILAVVAAIAIIAPILLSIGINLADIASPEDVEGVAALLLTRWALLLWILVALFVLFGVFVALHSLVEAGSARVYVDAERVAGPALEGPRSRFKVFSMQRWWTGAAEGWWTVFWIYNLAWGAAGVILLVPLLPTFVLLLFLRDDDQPYAAIATGCLGLVVTLLLFVIVAIVAAIWINRAIVDWAIRRAGARDALAAGWQATRADLGRHVLIAVALYVVMMAGSTFFASFSFAAGLGEAVSDSGFALMFTLPLRMFGTLCSYAFTAGVTAWFLAAYAGVATE
ncbi:MAG TPA: hypothetical protein VGF28_00285 [Thermoanaerobaculia bacterium]